MFFVFIFMFLNYKYKYLKYFDNTTAMDESLMIKWAGPNQEEPISWIPWIIKILNKWEFND